MTTRDLKLGAATSVSAEMAALMRGFLAFFVTWSFAILHPGGKRLRMEWYLLAMCQAFQQTALGRINRLVINVPPRHLKSITATAYTAWMLGRSPWLKIMFATYGDKLGRDHLERLQIIINHPVYRFLFPDARLENCSLSQGLLKTTRGGGCRIVTVGGATTGFGADIILIDDAMNAHDINSEARCAEVERFFRSTLLTRLDSKRRGIMISIQQRLGENDLPAWMLDAGADHLCLPSYDDQERVYDLGFGRIYRRPAGELLRPDDEPMKELDRIRRGSTPRDFATQYLQQPSALEGNIIPTNHFHRFALEDLPREQCTKVVQSWDTASSEEPGAAFSVCLTFGYRDRKWYLLHALRMRLNYPDLRDMVVAQRRAWGADKVLIENASSGTHLYHDLRYKNEPLPIMMDPGADKVTRMVGQLAMIEDGAILIPYQAPWLDVFLREMRAFPASTFKDQVDALSQFLSWAKRNNRWAQTEYDPKTGRQLYIVRRDKVVRR